LLLYLDKKSTNFLCEKSKWQLIKGSSDSNYIYFFILLKRLIECKENLQEANIIFVFLLKTLDIKKDLKKRIVALFLLHFKCEKKDPIEVLKKKYLPKLKTFIKSFWHLNASTRPFLAQIIMDLKHIL
jgi:hypothetical protein